MRGYCLPGAPQCLQVLPHWALGPVPCCQPHIMFFHLLPWGGQRGVLVLLVSCHPLYSKEQTQVGWQVKEGWGGEDRKGTFQRKQTLRQML